MLAPILTICITLCTEALARHSDVSPGEGTSETIAAVMVPQWNSITDEFYGTTYEILIQGNDVYIGGEFENAEGVPDADYLARWNGCEWFAVGPGLNGAVRAIAIDGDDIYVGGDFSAPFPNIARWDGSQWHPLGSGPMDVVNSIIIDGSDIIAGCGVWYTGFVSKWNGTTWQTLGPALNGKVNVVAKNGMDLYAAGNFTDADGNTNADGIVKWNGNTWLNLGTGVTVSNTSTGVREILFENQEVYISGLFTDAGGNQAADHIAVWDGDHWENTGIIPYSFLGLYPITIFNGHLYTAIGAGYMPLLDGIYRYNPDTENWELFELIETGPDDPILVLTSDASNLYLGGFGGLLMYWGEPFQNQITISGIPDAFCETDPPASLPSIQNGYTGHWTGQGVLNNQFDPEGLNGNIAITFIPDDPICHANFNLTVYDCFNPPLIDWKWAGAFSDDTIRESTGEPKVFGIDTDTSMAVYTTGYFLGEVDFNPGPADSILKAEGIIDGFICKLNNEGNFEWAGRIGGTGSAIAPFDVDLDEEGNVYITGSFSWNVDFDPGPETYSVQAAGEGDLFILKLDGEGHFQWVKTMGGDISTCYGAHITIEKGTGNIYTTGSLNGIVDFDPGPETYQIVNTPYSIFISKLDSLGQFIWAKSIAGNTISHFTSGTSIEVSPANGDVYVAGHFYESCDFDPGSGIDSLTSNGEADIFLLKLDSSGHYIRSLQFGATGNDWCPSISLGIIGDENIYVSGGFEGTVDFDPGPGLFNLTSSADIFICKLDTAGQFIWAKSLGGNIGLMDYTGSSFLYVDNRSNESVYTACGFNGTADFDPGPEQVLRTSAGGSDIFVSKIDSSGHFEWVKTAGGTSNDFAISLTMQAEGNILTTGSFASLMVPFDHDTIHNTGDPDVFVAKVGGCTTVVTNTNDSGPGSLRDIIHCAQPGDPVTFDLPPSSTITLTSGEITLGKDLTLIGPGPNNLTLSSNFGSRIFFLPLDVNIHAEGLALKYTNPIHNGGAILTRGNLKLKDMLFQGNLQNNDPKSLTLFPSAQLKIEGQVQMKE